jgi:hypothetical protein
MAHDLPAPYASRDAKTVEQETVDLKGIHTDDEDADCSRSGPGISKGATGISTISRTKTRSTEEHERFKKHDHWRAIVEHRCGKQDIASCAMGLNREAV